jgi:sugar/nucleoside kinase (ribokinase family)
VLGVVGDLVQDTVVWLGEPLQIGSDTKGEVHTSRGGSAANVAATAASLTPTRFIGCVGSDVLGDVLAASLAAEGVDVRLQRRGATGVVVVFIDEVGERTMIPSRGASALLDNVDQTWLEDVSVLHLTSYSLEQGTAANEVVRLATMVTDRGGAVTIDTSSSAMLAKFGLDRYMQTLRSLVPRVVFANEQEWGLLALDDVERIRPTGLEQAVFVRKAGGNPTTVHLPDGAPITVVVPEVAKVIDTTGAGDAFAGGFLARFVEGAPLRECCETGHAMAARVLTHPGARAQRQGRQA